MNSFFNSVRLTFDNRESVIKDTLIKEFSENVKEIQYEHKENATGEMSREWKYCDFHQFFLCFS